MVNRLLVFTLLLIAVVVRVDAQTRMKTAPAPSSGLLASLPESDAIAQIKIKVLLNEVMPRLLANNPTKLAEANAEIENFKTKTGLDPRSFDQVALSVRYSYPAEGITKLQTVGLASGTFNPGAMVAAGRIATNGKYREEKYQGKTIYIFSLDESIKVLGLFDLSIRDLAACPLDANTLALGDPNSIRSVIDVSGGRKRNNAELISLATKDPNAVIGFGSNMSPQLLQNMRIPNASVANDMAALRQVYGSVAATEPNIDLFIGARTTNAEAARNLGDTLEGLKQLGTFFIGRLSGARGVLAKSALNNLKIVTQANELQIRTAVAQADVAPLFGK
ncbi:MAG: hypothetical protein C5B55_13890 [Blastocatellia bacterium]|nr:MAG: hypothetical protein C5B55_13890 [Blastocatellia bacterium]